MPRSTATLLAVVAVTAACQATADETQPHHVQWGAYLPDLNGTDVTSDAGVVGVATRADQSLDLILTFSALNEPVPLDDLATISASGATPVVTIEPWEPDGGPEQPDYRLDTFATGVHDADLRRWGQQLADWGQPVLLRFAHEMNGDWYPWGITVNGNTAEAYRNTWIRMHEIIRSAGAENVSFVWAPMAAVSGIADFEAAYPGAEYVDRLGLDGYNWGDDGVHGWASPDYIFADSLRRLRALDDAKPILVAEVASADDPDPTRKADWITHFVRLMTITPGVEGFVWFQANKERDWRFNSNPLSESAFRKGLADVPGV
ncbi:glycosyl hydrolase [Gordonia sp. PKS22-38]|uniref:Glycosyl hydrolase n=1 Tax=Gordonia prachuapensis TaxID=3115651 RepID=A0ABU7MZX5_9ACTN|nr:glycosyl hydrolase [Gordonia sp. PKS22-38]